MITIKEAIEAAEKLWPLVPRPSTIMKPVGKSFWWNPSSNTFARREESGVFAIYARDSRVLAYRNTLSACRSTCHAYGLFPRPEGWT